MDAERAIGRSDDEHYATALKSRLTAATGVGSCSRLRSDRESARSDFRNLNVPLTGLAAS
jgi:hypothetical protein